jgi:proline iminopeptidase
MEICINDSHLWFDVEGAYLAPDGPYLRARPTVIALHGGPGSFDHSYLRSALGVLAQANQVVYLDLPGHGRSTWGDPEAWSFERCAEAVRRFSDTLGIVKPVVYGHSLGGFVAMVYAADNPGHPSGLVLQSTLGRFDLDRLMREFRRVGGDEVAEIAARFYGGERASVSAEEWEICRAYFGPVILSEDERARIVANNALNEPGLALMRHFDVLDRLHQVTCPVLVSTGDLDPIAPVSAAREIVSALPKGQARLAVIAGAGHFPWKDVPEQYGPLVAEFTESLSL